MSSKKGMRRAPVTTLAGAVVAAADVGAAEAVAPPAAAPLGTAETAAEVAAAAALVGAAALVAGVALLLEPELQAVATRAVTAARAGRARVRRLVGMPPMVVLNYFWHISRMSHCSAFDVTVCRSAAAR